MILTKEHQEAMLDNYGKTHTFDEVLGFRDGMEAMFNFIDSKLKEKESIDECSCGREAVVQHSCPYQEEINEDISTLCNCCKECTQQCAWDI